MLKVCAARGSGEAAADWPSRMRCILAASIRACSTGGDADTVRSNVGQWMRTGVPATSTSPTGSSPSRAPDGLRQPEDRAVSHQLGDAALKESVWFLGLVLRVGHALRGAAARFQTKFDLRKNEVWARGVRPLFAPCRPLICNRSDLLQVAPDRRGKVGHQRA